MRQEIDIRARLQNGEAELASIQAGITQLQYQVRDGGPGWRAALQALAEQCERRRTLDSELEGLRWVLASEAERATGGRQSA